MDKKQELRQRIIAGQQKVNHLSELASKLPHGKKRDELYDKSIRMLQLLESLEEGFIELYPGYCLYTDIRCGSKNKGCFPCTSCPEYLNNVYGVGQKQEALF